MGLPLSVLNHGRLYATNRAYNISYDDGPPPDEQADELANAAGKISTEIGVVPDENGDGTSADAPASPLAETARVQIAYPLPLPTPRTMGVAGIPAHRAGRVS